MADDATRKARAWAKAQKSRRSEQRARTSREIVCFIVTLQHAEACVAMTTFEGREIDRGGPPSIGCVHPRRPEPRIDGIDDADSCHVRGGRRRHVRTLSYLGARRRPEAWRTDNPVRQTVSRDGRGERGELRGGGPGGPSLWLGRRQQR